jgi:hypothetical protein
VNNRIVKGNEFNKEIQKSLFFDSPLTFHGPRNSRLAFVYPMDARATVRQHAAQPPTGATKAGKTNTTGIERTSASTFFGRPAHHRRITFLIWIHYENHERR